MSFPVSEGLVHRLPGRNQLDVCDGPACFNFNERPACSGTGNCFKPVGGRQRLADNASDFPDGCHLATRGCRAPPGCVERREFRGSRGIIVSQRDRTSAFGCRCVNVGTERTGGTRNQPVAGDRHDSAGHCVCACESQGCEIGSDVCEGRCSHAIEVLPGMATPGRFEVPFVKDAGRGQFHAQPCAAIEPVVVGRVTAEELVSGPCEGLQIEHHGRLASGFGIGEHLIKRDA